MLTLAWNDGARMGKSQPAAIPALTKKNLHNLHMLARAPVASGELNKSLQKMLLSYEIMLAQSCKAAMKDVLKFGALDNLGSPSKGCDPSTTQDELHFSPWHRSGTKV